MRVGDGSGLLGRLRQGDTYISFFAFSCTSKYMRFICRTINTEDEAVERKLNPCLQNTKKLEKRLQNLHDTLRDLRRNQYFERERLFMD